MRGDGIGGRAGGGASNLQAVTKQILMNMRLQDDWGNLKKQRVKTLLLSYESAIKIRSGSSLLE